MSASYPRRSGLNAASLTATQGTCELAFLRAEIAALKAENENLRQSLAAAPIPSPARTEAPQVQGMPVLFHLTDAGAQLGDLQFASVASLTALGSFFPIGIFRTDAAGLLTAVDSNLRHMFGLELPALAHFGWLAAVHPEDRQRVQNRWLESNLQPHGQSIEARLQHPDGQIRHVLLCNTPMFNAAGALQGQLGFVQDLTELCEREARTKLNEELNRQIIASSADCNKVLDLQGRVLQMTAKGCHLMEVDDFEAVRNADWGTWWPGEGARVARASLAGAARGETTRFVGFGPTFKGTPKWWDTVITPICNAAGEPAMLLAVSRDISEMHRRQEETQALNERLELRELLRTQELAAANQRTSHTLAEAQALYHQAPCGYHSLDGAGTYLRINQTELDWLGYQRDEVIGKMHFCDQIPPELQRQVQSRLQRLQGGETLEPHEVEMVRRDGRRFQVLLGCTASFDDRGHFAQINSTVVDITARKAAELALRANQRFVQAITDHLPGLMVYLDADLRFRFANANCLTVYGMDPKKILGQPLRKCISSEVFDAISPRLQAALAGETQRFEVWRQTVQGQPIFVSATYLPDLHEGKVRGLFIQMIDITERKQIEARVSELNTELELRIGERSADLLQSELRFRLMVDNMRDHAAFFMSADGAITDWTDSAQRMDGFSPTEMLGQHYTALFERSDGENAREQAEKMLRLAASRGQHEVNGWHQRRDGSRYWAHGLLIALRDNGGELRGFAKITRDMTDTKRLDDLLQNLNAELEQRVAVRTEQLLTANKDLESFSYSVSHDLRSPLRHISSFVSLLQEHLGDRCDELSTRYLSTIGTSARHMSQLIDGLLAFSRLGRSAVNIAPVNFALLTATVVAQLAHDTEGRIVDWVVAPDLPVVQGDALLLREVWANLLGNAFKYSRPRERARIEVGWTVDSAAGYTFFVRDNGVGFDTKYAQKLFGVFQRLHRLSEFEGTGIGLALTRRIIERHGGTIWAESELGEGSVFSFSLPFESLHAADAAQDPIFGAPS
jgi:PAS domain S-box-containing protein